tara:strand:- start:208 stop:477 length:270 start_codon:yes stop_codon:yes gene_type:complete
MQNAPRNFLFTVEDDQPYREATPEEVTASLTGRPSGVISVSGHEYYVDHYYGEDLEAPEEDWQEDWRREIAREEGMLGGINAYNDYMGY